MGFRKHGLSYLGSLRNLHGDNRKCVAFSVEHYASNGLSDESIEVLLFLNGAECNELNLRIVAVSDVRLSLSSKVRMSCRTIDRSGLDVNGRMAACRTSKPAQGQALLRSALRSSISTPANSRL